MVLKHKTCGNALQVSEDTAHISCAACDTQQPLPLTAEDATEPTPHPEKPPKDRKFGKTKKDRLIAIFLIVFSILCTVALIFGAIIPAYEHNVIEDFVHSEKEFEALDALDEATMLRRYWPETWESLVGHVNRLIDSIAVELVAEGELVDAYELYIEEGRTPPAHLEQAMQGSYTALLEYYGLTEFTVPDGVTTISATAFAGCEELVSLELPNSVTEIAKGALADCQKLSTLSLPFVGATANDTEHAYLGYLFGAESYEENNTIVPLSLQSLCVTGETSIADRAFYNCDSLAEVTLKKGVTSVGEEAFYSCSGLVIASLPTTVTQIGFRAFYGCNSLARMTLPFIGSTADDTENTHLGYIFGAESYTSNAAFVPFTLRVLVLSGGTEIAERTFYHCAYLSLVTLPASVERIGSYAFYGCHSLSFLNLPNNTSHIGEYAFYGCDQLSSLILPHTLSTVGYAAFHGCTGLKSLIIPHGVTVIGDFAFAGCTGLTEVSLPDGVTTIGGRAFSDCTALVSITLPDTLTEIGGQAFYNCSALTAVTLPDSLTAIGFETFYGCSSLEQITLPYTGNVKDGTEHTHFGFIFGAAQYSTHRSFVPASLKTVVLTNAAHIANNAFFDCPELTAIVLCDSLVAIGSGAFDGCHSLAAVYYEGNAAGWEKIAIEGYNSNLTHATRYDYAEAQPCAEGNYWHYDAQGNIAVWP